MSIVRGDFIWPVEFDTKDFKEKTKEELCIDGLVAWANKFAGANHPNFREMIAKISDYLEIIGDVKSFEEKAGEMFKGG